MEEQFRNTAVLNAIFGAMNSIGADCHPPTKNINDIKPKQHLKDFPLKSFSTTYGKDMGILEMDFTSFLAAVCDEEQYKILKINWHPNARGHRTEADIYAYTLLSAAINFMNKYKKDINKMKTDKSTNTLDDWLVKQSGDWASKYMQSIVDEKNNDFPPSLYCQPFCDKTIAP
eukprot:166199_1